MSYVRTGRPRRLYSGPCPGAGRAGKNRGGSFRAATAAGIFQAICSARVYLFDQAAQDEKLLSMLTCHSLRRNFCTGLYCDAQLDTPEIYRQMGHEYKQQPYRVATGLTPEELRLMYLRKHVSASLYHPANPLRYSVDGAPHATEVPACEIQLTIPPGACIELTVEDTETLPYGRYVWDLTFTDGDDYRAKPAHGYLIVGNSAGWVENEGTN